MFRSSSLAKFIRDIIMDIKNLDFLFIAGIKIKGYGTKEHLLGN